jgi:hypothetical protein
MVRLNGTEIIDEDDVLCLHHREIIATKQGQNKVKTRSKKKSKKMVEKESQKRRSKKKVKRSPKKKVKKEGPPQNRKGQKQETMRGEQKVLSLEVDVHTPDARQERDR